MGHNPNGNSARASRNLRTLVIEPFRQIRFGLYIIGLCLAFVLAAGLLFFTSFWEQYEHIMGLFNVIDPSLKWQLITNDVFYTNLLRLGLLIATFLILLLILVFRLTHRYYGPLVAIDRFLREVSAGNYKARIQVRKKDELNKLANDLNHLAENLDERHGSNSSNTNHTPDR